MPDAKEALRKQVEALKKMRDEAKVLIEKLQELQVAAQGSQSGSSSQTHESAPSS